MDLSVLLLQQEAALQEAVAQGQERERLLLDQHQQVCLSRSVLRHTAVLYKNSLDCLGPGLTESAVCISTAQRRMRPLVAVLPQL